MKDLVWKLGYTQGYHYGAHDGRDAEIMHELKLKKQSYQDKIAVVRAWMDTHIEEVQAGGDVAAAASQAEIDALQEVLRQEMEAAIVVGREALEAAIAINEGGDEAVVAREALLAYIAERQAVWDSKAAQEEANAKWQ